ncbi:MAG: YqgE/AlgH family protein [Flavobacteriaceae bacterium]|nr:YqgE/AlgH family protein [Flavobacteriaceae bacterium]
MAPQQPKKGQLLIAEPSILGDVSFNRSVILLADYSSEGSIGFILNKPLDFMLKDLLPEIEGDFKVYNGGPVEQDNLYFIHIVPDLIPNSVEISNGIYWAGDFTTVTQLINTHSIQVNDIRFFLGYSGWDNNQLADELKSKTWVLKDNIYKTKVIAKRSSSFWKEKMLEFGGEYSIWSNAPNDPSNN